MSIAVIITDRDTEFLCELLRQKLPEVCIQQWPDIKDLSAVQMAVLWSHPQGITKNMSNLTSVVSMGAGMDHIIEDVDIAAHIKCERIVTSALKQHMAQYVIQHILTSHRHFYDYQKQQLQKHWQVLEKTDSKPIVGFLGLGELGCFVADRCVDLGLETVAWTAQQKHHIHKCYQGMNGLREVCRASQYLVVLLPLNDETFGVINKKTLSWCGPETVLINVGRGPHVVEGDLLSALDQGIIKRAILDVFNDEPLPINHPYWEHEKITITPHSSARSDIKETADQIVAYYNQL